MAVDLYKEVASKTVADRQRSAVDKVLGLPKRGTNRGLGPHAVVPDVYVRGAVGWTATECDVIEDAQSGTALLVLTSDAVSLGARTVDVDGSPVNIDFSTGVVNVKPAKYERADASADEKPQVSK